MERALIDTSRIETLAREFEGFEEQVAEATYHALNRMMDSTINKVGTLVQKQYDIKQSEVVESFNRNSKKPTRSNLECYFLSKGHLLSFAHFPFSPDTDIRARRGESIFKSAVSVSIKRKSGAKTSKQGFVATTGAVRSEAVQFNVFKRLTKNRFPIAPIRTLSIPQMVTAEGMEEKIQSWAIKTLDKRLDHEIQRAMLNMGSRMR
jgi:hypothetical protein